MEVKDTSRTVVITIEELTKFIEEKTGKSFENFCFECIDDDGKDSIEVEFTYRID